MNWESLAMGAGLLHGNNNNKTTEKLAGLDLEIKTNKKNVGNENKNNTSCYRCSGEGTRKTHGNQHK